MKAKKSDPAIVAIGGGTGLSTMLRGLKRHTGNITAIVTMADDGGGSGKLRDELGMPPPGDVRNCLRALANTEPTMEEILEYRFTEGCLKGQSLGNLVLAALSDISGSFVGAVGKLSDVLAITGKVLPVTTQDVRLLARFDDGEEVLGESKIRDFKKQGSHRISRVKLLPENPPALRECLRAIESADLILFGPGSLYTSIIPNLLTDGIVRAITQSDALKIYVLNVATEDGETDGYTASDHIRALFSHCNGRLFDYCLANSEPFPQEVLSRHQAGGGLQVALDSQEVERLGVCVISAPMLNCDDGYAHHDSDLLAAAIMDIYTEKSPTKIYS